MGIRRRIMMYVTAGLVLMFGALIVVGLRALDQATTLVFEARLSTAKNMALTLERDVIHLSLDVRGFGDDLLEIQEGAELDRQLTAVIEHLTASDSFAFFDPNGIQILNQDGRLLASAGAPFTSDLPAAAATDSDYSVLVPTVGGSEAPRFGVVATRVGSGPGELWVLVHVLGRNSTSPFIPEDFLQPRTAPRSPVSASSEDAYHLELFDATGTVILAIGEEVTPGRPSPHFAAISERSPLAEPVVLRHAVTPGSDETNHVMGVVPLPDLGFTLILEQPIDVALALPLRLRRQLITWSSLGFAAALVVAWVTTRAVIKPTRQLTLAAQRIAGGDLASPIAVQARDEFGVLADRFESMRQQISSAYEAVEEANQVLESRVQERTARLGMLLDRVISAQEEERARLARELHDETVQTLGALSIALGRSAETFPVQAGASFEQLVMAREMVALLLEETRRLILDLRPMLLDDMGLLPAIRWQTESRFAATGIVATFHVDTLPDRFPAHVETALFRIVQEATNNVAKHSEAGNVDLSFSVCDGAVRIVVSDDGKGFEMGAGAGGSVLDEHVGLAGMRERVNLLGGAMTVVSRPDSGTTVSVEIPVMEMGG